MPVLRFIDSDPYGIVTEIESIGASEELLSTLDKIHDPKIAIKILQEDNWYLLQDGRSNGDNQEYVFTKD
jgi:hypothetical protein